MAVKWMVDWNGYQLNFVAHGSLEAHEAPRISLEATHGAVVAARAWFKVRRQWFRDGKLSRDFDQIVISNIEVSEGHQRIGLGTEVVRSVARRFPEALIVGENPNGAAQAWHSNRLDIVFPSRMMRIEEGGEVRVSPGVEVDQNEL